MDLLTKHENLDELHQALTLMFGMYSKGLTSQTIPIFTLLSMLDLFNSDETEKPNEFYMDISLYSYVHTTT